MNKSSFQASLFILILCVISHKIDAQKLISNSCTLQYDDWAEFCLESIIFSPKYSSNREEASIEGVDFSSMEVSTLRHVSGTTVCSQIKNLLVTELGLPENSPPNSKFKRYFYETDEFFYVFWGPEPGKVILTTITTQKVVIKKDFSQHWVFQE